jgi:hemoglobin
MPENESVTIFRLVGGFETFERLVEAFYERVEQDPVLRPLYPESLSEPKENLALFLAMYFGGPPEYMERRGHPRLRARHFPFAIGWQERDAWVKNMLAAVDATGIEEPARSEMVRYFQDAATFLINREETDIAGERLV